MKVLFLSNLFPDTTEPNRGSYNATLLQYLAQLCEVRVLSPRPMLWPRRKEYFSCEEHKQLHPAYPVSRYIPKVGSRWNHLLMAGSIWDELKRSRDAFGFDVVLSSWVYPDACAVAELAREFQFPFVAIAQGSDVHQYVQNPVRRKIIRTSLNQSRAVIARSSELSRLLIEAGVEENKLHVIYNGIDSNIFHPADQRQARAQLQLRPDAVVLLFVGNLLPIKNPLLLLRAHAEVCRRLPGRNVLLLIIGTGPLQAILRKEAMQLGFAERVSFVGRKPANEVARYMQAANALCVSSNNEGVPNVILESFACGLRVAATDVGGIPEVLCHNFLGQLVEAQNPIALADAIAQIVSGSPQTEKIVTYANGLSWEKTARNYYQLLNEAISTRV